ncbi:alpha/beta hydrolase family protein [Sulfobacillus harzensis]|uniref:S9 family peptidase n=1 Tax=Sulfobacillus harzensis TaxID=2729629 RepID=A0A7Y0Q4G9_9FIRM|nr:S9 family peptidase [Sulfobacillus harzensis]NMP23239.1 S9 family peptidase [Sulfobacillus harzensis]
MRVEDLWEIRTWGMPVFDPVRPRLYFVESWLDKRENCSHSRIMRMMLDDETVAPITLGPGDTFPVPSPDGTWLGFLSRRSGSSQVWRLPLSGGEAEQVTRIQGGVKSFAWLHDGEFMIVVAHVEHGLLEAEHPPSEPRQDASDGEWERWYTRGVKRITHQYYKLDGQGFFDQGRDQLVRVEVKTGRPTLLTSGFDNYSHPVLAADDGMLWTLVRRYDSRPESHPSATVIVSLDAEKGAETILAEPELAIENLAVGREEQVLYFTGSVLAEMGYGNTSLYRLDLGDGRWINLSHSTDRPVGDASGADVAPPTRLRPIEWRDMAVMTFSDHGRVTLAAFGENGEVRPLFDAKQVVLDFAVKDDQVCLVVTDPTHPSGLQLARLDGEANPVRWAPAPWGDGDGPRPVEEIVAHEADGTAVQTWCLLPSGDGPHPVVLEVHGGPMSMYGYRYHHEFQSLAAHGYAVVYTNPRGSVGYGAEFCRTIMGQWGDKDYRDVMAGLDAALSAWPSLDRTHLGVAGGSYGGFMVNWIISHSTRFSAAVTMRSVVNRFSAMGSSDLGFLRVPQYGEKPWWEDPEPYWQQSPLRYASAIRTPLLIEHQEKDFRLPIEQGEQLYSALKYMGRTVEMLLYPDESHGMSRSGKPWHRIYRLNSIINWFDRYLSRHGDNAGQEPR